MWSSTQGKFVPPTSGPTRRGREEQPGEQSACLDASWQKRPRADPGHGELMPVYTDPPDVVTDDTVMHLADVDDAPSDGALANVPMTSEVA